MNRSQIDAKLEAHRMTKHCPSCGNKLDCKPDWVGLPAGVKFDPTDQELIEHLEAKVKEGVRSHPLIDEFIPTIEGEDGICYTHPEKLPGVTTDGLSKHFFHRPSKAYTTGTRKRRKIQTECDLQRSGDTRWHKTGKTRPVMVNGTQKGCKKILVLYTNFGKHRKPEKTNWVMHQYHLGELEEEKEGELLVSKIFYQTQPRQCNWTERKAVGGEGVADNRRDSTGSGSCSSKEAMSQRIDEAGISGYSGNIELHHQHQHHQQPHLKHDNFSFSPFRKTFEEAGIGDVPAKAREMHEEREHQRPQAGPPATTAYLVNRTADAISTIISPPMQHPSVVLEDTYHVPSIILQPKFSQTHQKLDHRSTAGLEELIMGCTSSSVKGETSIPPHTQETEWQYTYWSPDNADHHGDTYLCGSIDRPARICRKVRNGCCRFDAGVRFCDTNLDEEKRDPMNHNIYAARCALQ